MIINENSKKQVRNRMLKKAAQLWGIPANEIDISFDPIISILITACAAEIEKIAAEVNDSQTRITEKIIQLMTPETIFGSRPAHAILSAAPLEKSVTVKPEYLFTHKKKTTYKNTSQNFKNIYFSPIQDFKIVNAAVKYIATGNSIYENSSFKETSTLFTGNKRLPPSTIYLGILTEEKKISYKDVSFYFETKNLENKKLFYHHLKNAQWFTGDKMINVTDGFYNTEENNRLKLDTIFNDTSSKTHNIIEQIRNNYVKHYITFKEDVRFDSTFEELDAIFENNKINIKDNVKWIKVVFPRVINNSILKELYCSLNAFPVINRELKSFTYQLKDFINIIPVITDSLFLDIKEISNTEGKTYKLQSKTNDNNEKGVFNVRTDNVGKLDHRKAGEYIKHLIELLKDESAAFAYFNNDLLHKNLNKLNQLISLLENKVSEISMKVVDSNFINITPYRKRENLIIEYWSTEGEDANNIKLGSSLKIYNGIGVKQKSCILLTSSYGGKNDLSMSERLNTYRRSLLSRDRIVTKQDIKALCAEVYGDKITSVVVKKGYMKDISLNKGLVHCINIDLMRNSNTNNDEYEWESLNNNLLLFLEKYSVSIFPYNINVVDS